jgi:hypothetical protein
VLSFLTISLLFLNRMVNTLMKSHLNSLLQAVPYASSTAQLSAF